jgi:hypothetical protein
VTFRSFLIRARDDLLRDGERVTPGQIVDHALTYENAWTVYNAEADRSRRAKARRDASALLSEVEGEGADPEIASLFDVTRYKPPRALSFVDDSGVIRHVATEHGTRWEGERHTPVLGANITAAVRKYDDWRAFWRQIDPYLDPAPDARIIDALRRMQDEGEAAA